MHVILIVARTHAKPVYYLTLECIHIIEKLLQNKQCYVNMNFYNCMDYCKLGQIITVHSQFIHADEGMDGEAVCLAFALAKAKHTNQSGPVVVATTTGPD